MSLCKSAPVKKASISKKELLIPTKALLLWWGIKIKIPARKEPTANKACKSGFFKINPTKIAMKIPITTRRLSQGAWKSFWDAYC